MSASLEEKRLAILTKIKLSRAAYKKFLIQEAGENNIFSESNSHFGIANFPRSRTFQWIDKHPILATAAMGSLIYLGAHSLKSQNLSHALAKQAHYVFSAKKTLNRIFRICSTFSIIKNFGNSFETMSAKL